MRGATVDAPPESHSRPAYLRHDTHSAPASGGIQRSQIYLSKIVLGSRRLPTTCVTRQRRATVALPWFISCHAQRVHQLWLSDDSSVVTLRGRINCGAPTRRTTVAHCHSKIQTATVPLPQKILALIILILLQGSVT